MSRTSVTLSISRILPLVLALAALFIWTSVAQAQALEIESYDDTSQPVAAADTSAGGGGDAGSGVQGISLLPADTAAPTSAGGDAGSGVQGISLSPADAAAPTSAGGGGAAESGVIGISLLPSTGGPLLPLIGLGAIALGATCLLARHRYSRR